VNGIDIPWPTKAHGSWQYLYSVVCIQKVEDVVPISHTERVWADSAEEALTKVRDMFIGQLKRETDLHTIGPRGKHITLKITMAELKQAREPKPVQLELPL
jgi:hypothetical protein